MHDCGLQEAQRISYDEFEKSLNVNVPGMSKRNTIRTFTFPDKLPSELEVAKKGFSYKAERFLHPPVKLFGVPAMRKLAKEILDGDDRQCFEHMVTYATSPPLLPSTLENSHGMRFRQADVLETLGERYGVSKWTEASIQFRQSGKSIIELCRAALKMDRRNSSELLTQIANIEERAYILLKDETLQ